MKMSDRLKGILFINFAVLWLPAITFAATGSTIALATLQIVVVAFFLGSAGLYFYPSDKSPITKEEEYIDNTHDVVFTIMLLMIGQLYLALFYAISMYLNLATEEKQEKRKNKLQTLKGH